MPWTVEPVRDLLAMTEVEVRVETVVEIDASANL
jgi:ribonuclease HII